MIFPNLLFERISQLSVLDPRGRSGLQPLGHCGSSASELHFKNKVANVVPNSITS